MEQHGKAVSRNNYNENTNISSEEAEMELRRGPWTVDEDFTLINYIAHHGEGRWNSLARCAGLKRTGKSCRLRWLNYLRPDVRRGNITLEEQLLILELHSRWGNRWSKIAQHLPGRTDNEIKNYWRTRVQKHAKQLRCDVNSKQFKDTMRYLWMPRLVERIQAANANANANATYGMNNLHMVSSSSAHETMQQQQPNNNNISNSSGSESFGTSPVSDLTESCYNNYPATATHVNNSQDYYPAPAPAPATDHDQSLTSPIAAAASTAYFNQTTTSGLDFMDQNGTNWMDGGDATGNLWDVDDMWFLHQHFDTTTTV